MASQSLQCRNLTPSEAIFRLFNPVTHSQPQACELLVISDSDVDSKCEVTTEHIRGGIVEDPSTLKRQSANVNEGEDTFHDNAHSSRLQGDPSILELHTTGASSPLRLQTHGIESALTWEHQRTHESGIREEGHLLQKLRSPYDLLETHDINSDLSCMNAAVNKEIVSIDSDGHHTDDDSKPHGTGSPPQETLDELGMENTASFFESFQYKDPQHPSSCTEGVALTPPPAKRRCGVQISEQKAAKGQHLSKRRRVPDDARTGEEVVPFASMSLERQNEVRDKWSCMVGENAHNENKKLQVLVAAILHAKTTSGLVRSRMEDLRAWAKVDNRNTLDSGVLTPDWLANLSSESLIDHLDGIHWHRVKASRIIAIGTAVKELTGGIPCHEDDLLKLPGIGPKLARVVANVYKSLNIA